MDIFVGRKKKDVCEVVHDPPSACLKSIDNNFDFSRCVTSMLSVVLFKLWELDKSEARKNMQNRKLHVLLNIW